MKELIRKQLEKVTVADLSHYNGTEEFIIPKYNRDRFEENKCYLIEIDRCLTVNNPNSILQVNWNNNTYPFYQFLKIDVSKVMGKMIKVNSIGYDPQTMQDINVMWSGWLPNDLIRIISIL